MERRVLAPPGGDDKDNGSKNFERPHKRRKQIHLTTRHLYLKHQYHNKLPYIFVSGNAVMRSLAAAYGISVIVSWG
jgi:hypothetical protein